MKISRNSWHYKAVDFIVDDYKISNSLCLYFWQVVWSVTVISITPTFVVVLLLHVLYAMAYPITQIWIETNAGLAFISGMLWILTAMALRSVLKEEGKLGKPLFTFNWLFKKKEQAYKEPSLVVEYIKAKKEKICPRIEFE